MVLAVRFPSVFVIWGRRFGVCVAGLAPNKKECFRPCVMPNLLSNHEHHSLCLCLLPRMSFDKVMECVEDLKEKFAAQVRIQNAPLLQGLLAFQPELSVICDTELLVAQGFG